jgi:putative transposase
VLLRLAYLTLGRSIQLLMFAARGDATKDLELLVLRPKLEPTDRAMLATVSRALPRARWSWVFVKPETLLGWHRRLIAGAWTNPHGASDRPQLDTNLQQLIIRLAREKSSLGLSAHPGRTPTAWRASLGNRDPRNAATSWVDPAPRRAATTWRAFLRQQAAGRHCCVW